MSIITQSIPALSITIKNATLSIPLGLVAFIVLSVAKKDNILSVFVVSYIMLNVASKL